MSRLTALARVPRLDRRRAAPHRYRARGGRVLVTNDFGGFAFLSEAEHADLVEGRVGPDHPRRAELQRAGFLRDFLKLDDLAEDALATSLLGWRGPGRHVLVLDGGGAAMTPETAREAVDFAFSSPSGPLELELRASSGAAWPALWFAAAYARRKAQWYGRALALTARLEGNWDAGRLDALAASGCGVRAVVKAGAPAEPSVAARSGLCLVGADASGAAAWVDGWAAAGWASVRLQPAEAPRDAAGVARFARFYGAALDRIDHHAASGSPLREEWAAAALSRRRWLVDGVDVLSQLAYGPGGEIASSERALGLAAAGEPVLLLGRLGQSRWGDLAGHPAVRAALSAAVSENQPLCSACAYKPFCAVGASTHLAAQGTLWGRLPESAACSLQLALLDLIFDRLAMQEARSSLHNSLS